jgi:pyruvate dehydrogenase E2 component (dihydrolipoamide acetyltransferase)
MITEVRVPSVSENVKQGKVVTVLVAPGDTVAAEQALIELETDKAVVEIPSPLAGRITEITVTAGETIAIGAVIARLETADAAAVDAAPAALVTPPVSAAPAVAAAPPAAKPIAPPLSAPARAAAPAPDRNDGAPDDAPAPASPSVRRLARELGVAIDTIAGSGPSGRISEDDVKAHARGLIEGGAAACPGPPCPADGWVLAATRPLPDFAQWGPVTREPLSRVREVTAETMSFAWATVPQVTQFDQADITELETFRKEFAARHPDSHLTMTAILVRVCAAALRDFPRFNTSLDAARREIVRKDYVHIGVAVDTEHGLLVPVVRDADRRGIVPIAAELATLSAKARTRRVNPADLEGGCFTISNLGGIGGTAFSPIVYPPQVAILGVSRAALAPVWRDGAFAPRLLLPLALSYDHRVIDGADGARFLRWICEALRQPLTMVMDAPA